MKLHDVELKALALVLKDLNADASRSDIIKGLQKVIDDYVPPEVCIVYDRSKAQSTVANFDNSSLLAWICRSL